MDNPAQELNLGIGSLYEQHRQVFEGYLPENVWEVIMKHVPNSYKKNVANSSPYFRQLLLNERVAFLFPDVLAVLSPMFEGRKFSIDKLQENGDLVDIKTGKSNAELMNELRSTGGLLIANRPHNDLWWRNVVLKCRLVCSAWKEGVEEVYQRPEMQGIPDFSKDIDPSSMLNTMFLDWHRHYVTNGTSGLIMRLFRNTTSNPFLFRHVVLTIMQSSIAENREFFDELLAMLRVYGKEIRYLDIQMLMVDYGNASTTRSKFLEFLSLMPNLESLNIEFLSVDLPKERFGDEPMPRFEKLKVLKVGKDEPELFTDLLRGNNHVKALILGRTNAREIVTADLPNLTSFQTKDSGTGERMLNDLGHQWELEKIQACRWVSGRPAETFRFLEKNWGSTLVDVHLSEGILEVKDQNLQLNLPNVKRFVLNVCGNMLDFMLPMKKLEHLEIKKVCESSKDSQIVQRIEFLGFFDTMQESNVWEFFPKLKTIKLHDSRRPSFDARPRSQLFTANREKFIYYGGEY